MSQIALKIRVVGSVQGVFFRAWTAERARDLGVAGWVRNLSDGSVEGHLEGDKLAVQELVDLLRQGPPSADVETVKVKVAEPEGSRHFEVRH
jgi:acylphosphatase